MFTPVNPAARVALIAFTLCVACESARTAPEPAPVALTSGALRSGNGIASNGIASNGIASNGIASNGIASNGIASNGIASNGIASNGMLTNGLSPGEGTNGLADNGLAQASLDQQVFKDWFAKDETYSAMVMTYVARCALPAGQSLTYTTATACYTFDGTLGLAPAWASGQAIPQAEQELVSACLAAHTNRFGQHVSISVRGFQADGAPIDVSSDERNQYTFDEACFFGNLFTGPGTFMAEGASSISRAEVSTPRGCAAENGTPTPCAPMVYAGSCADVCTLATDGAAEWVSCTANGVAYRPIHVLLQEKTLNICGDGVCQMSETSDSCPADCPPPTTTTTAAQPPADTMTTTTATAPPPADPTTTTTIPAADTTTTTTTPPTTTP